MTEDARFEDGGDKPLQLIAQDQADLEVISSLIQDAVLPVREIAWREGRFAMLLNRVRWEDNEAAQRANRSVERVQSVLVIDHVSKVSGQGISPKDKDVVLSVLSIAFEEGDSPSGAVTLTFAGDGALRCETEALEVRLRDVTRPYRAVAKQAPVHPA